MISVKIIFTCLVVAILIDLGSCWAFTNINPTLLAETFGDDEAVEEVDNGLSDEDDEGFQVKLIYPGTKWCGTGNIADNYDDLGKSSEADSCCRDHDNCPDVIEGGESKHNLTNKAFYSRLSCDCDLTFRQCLHDANTSTSKAIGKVYFNLLGTKCYKEDYPTTGCAKRTGLFNLRCAEYEFDTDGEKAYQWFDVPNY